MRLTLGLVLSMLHTLTNAAPVGKRERKSMLEEPSRVWSNVHVDMRWPAPPFTLACPDTQEKCDALTAQHTACPEPETETAEVLTSLLLGCDGSCLYVDVGCNLGYFAGLATKLGAESICVDAYPLWSESARRTARKNGPGFKRRMHVYHNAVIAEDDGPKSLDFLWAYHACGIAGESKPTQLANGEYLQWSTPTIPIRNLLEGKNVKLLKLDIDSIEGALLHRALDMLETNLTKIESILIELGDFPPAATFTAEGQPNWAPHPRSGHAEDLWRLQQMGYDVYRLNIHTNQELYDWRGVDVNSKPSTAPHLRDHFESLYGIRSMRKLDKLKRHADPSSYPGLIDAGHSFLITKVRLAEPVKHMDLDIKWTTTSHELNDGNPAIEQTEVETGPDAPGS